MNKSVITVNIDEDIRNQDWLKRPDELLIHDLVSEKLRKRHEEDHTNEEKFNNPPREKTRHEKS